MRRGLVGWEIGQQRCHLFRLVGALFARRRLRSLEKGQLLFGVADQRSEANAEGSGNATHGWAAF